MKKINLLIFLLFIFLGISNNAFGIGQMTDSIIINGFRSESYDEMMIINNTDASESTIKLSADGKIADWVKFFAKKDDADPITEIKIPANSRMNAIARFTIPGEIENGTYTGNINVSTLPGKSQSKIGVSVIQKVPRDVTITVSGDEIKKIDCFFKPLNLEVTSQNELRIEIECANNGNVSVSPVVKQAIFKESNEIVTAVIMYPSDKKPIRPTTSEKWVLSWASANRPAGDYRAELTMMLDGKPIEQRESFVFSINNSTTIDKNTFLASLLAGNYNQIIILIGVGVALVIALVSILFYRKKEL